jgi:hypothetical protein
LCLSKQSLFVYESRKRELKKKDKTTYKSESFYFNVKVGAKHVFRMFAAMVFFVFLREDQEEKLGA